MREKVILIRYMTEAGSVIGLQIKNDRIFVFERQCDEYENGCVMGDCVCVCVVFS